MENAENPLVRTQSDAERVEKAMLEGDVSKLDPKTRMAYHNAICESIGLNPLARPLCILKNQDGTSQFYFKREAAEMIRKAQGISIVPVSREVIGDLYVVVMRAWMTNGAFKREDEAQAIVPLTKNKKVQQGKWPNGDPKWVNALDENGDEILIPLRGQALANAMMACESKAKRRVTFSIAGLGFSEAPVEQDDHEDILEIEPFQGTADDAIENLFGAPIPQAIPEAISAPEEADDIVDEEIVLDFILTLESLVKKARERESGALAYTVDAVKAYIRMQYNRKLHELTMTEEACVVGWLTDPAKTNWLNGEIKKNSHAVKRIMAETRHAD